jgi:hypothetical protein
MGKKSRQIAVAVVAVGIVAGCSLASAQEAAQYQLIKVKYRLVDKNGDVLEKVNLGARLDLKSPRPPADRTLKVGDIEYSTDDPKFTYFSQQLSDSHGMVEVPIIVYDNRPDPIDYELGASYGTDKGNKVTERDQRQSFTSSDNGVTRTIRLDVVAERPALNYLIGLAAWVIATIMGALLFFRAIYQSLLSSGRPIDLSRALCWSGALLVSLTALGFVYYFLLPQVLNFYVFFGFLFVIWFLHLLFTVMPKRA